MSATNSTPNYGLPQYVADDKPTYLGDFNKAMLDIDSNMKMIDNKATSAEGSVATANSNASQALENSQTAQNTAETAQATATSAQNTATSAQSTATQAQSTAKQAAETANLLSSAIDNWISKNIGVNNVNLLFNGNKKMNLLGLSANVQAGQGNTSGNNTVIGTLPEEFRPSEDRTINGACIVYWSDSNSTLIRNLIIKTDGTVNCPVASGFTHIMVQCMLGTKSWY